MPASMLHGLGVRPTRRATFAMADGRRVDSELGEIRMRVNGGESWTVCVFAEEDTPPLLGAFSLEAFLLGIDPVHERLIPIEPMR